MKMFELCVHSEKATDLITIICDNLGLTGDAMANHPQILYVLENWHWDDEGDERYGDIGHVCFKPQNLDHLGDLLALFKPCRMSLRINYRREDNKATFCCLVKNEYYRQRDNFREFIWVDLDVNERLINADMSDRMKKAAALLR